MSTSPPAGASTDFSEFLDALEPDVRELVRPRTPLDAGPFEALSAEYLLDAISDRRRALTWLIAREIQRARSERGGPVRAIDIGCGRGMAREPGFTRAISAWVDELWGLEPDPGIVPEKGVFHRYINALLEDAELPENYFDLAYCYMVVEHLEDPVRFMHAAARCLRPGGSMIFVTVNGNHYFTRIASTARSLRLDELLLRVLRGKQTDDYHYPVRYLCNSTRQIRSVANRSGFDDVSIAFSEEGGGPKPYFPGPLRPALWAMNLKRRLIRNPDCLLTLYGRLTKATA